MKDEIKTAINRIRRMERIFVRLSQSPQRVSTDESLKKLYKSLLRYYENGKWLSDYTLDEKGLLPQKLKRGVLSEDGVYNLISEIEEAKNA